MRKIKEYTFADGKYKITASDDGSSLNAYRYDEHWQNLIGDNLIASMLEYIDNLEACLEHYNEKEMDNYFKQL